MSEPLAILYDAALGEEDWAAAIETIARSLGASTFILGAGDPRAPDRLELWSANWNTALLREGGYDLSDVWDPTVNPDVAAGLILPVGRAMHARQIVPEDTFRTSDFLQATVARAGLRDYHLYVPHREPDLLSGGFIAKGPGKEFDQDDVKRIDAVLGHVGRALRLRAQLDRQRSVTGNLSALFDELSYAVLLLDRAGEAVAANAAFERLVGQNDGILLARGRPFLGRQAGAAIDAALAVVDMASDRFPAFQGVPIIRPSGLPPYMARIYPAIGFATLRGAGAARVAVLIDDPADPELAPAPVLLAALFGLSEAEIAVARLLPTLPSRRAMAEAIGISENTVKTHLSSIRDKVGARSTAELTRILVRASSAGRR